MRANAYGVSLACPPRLDQVGQHEEAKPTGAENSPPRCVFSRAPCRPAAAPCCADARRSGTRSAAAPCPQAPVGCASPAFETDCCAGSFCPALRSRTATPPCRSRAAARAGSLRSFPPLPSRKRTTQWSVFSSAGLRSGLGALPLACGHPLRGPLRGRANVSSGSPATRYARGLLGAAPSTLRVDRRTRLPAPFGYGSASFAPNDLFCRSRPSASASRQKNRRLPDQAAAWTGAQAPPLFRLPGRHSATLRACVRCP